MGRIPCGASGECLRVWGPLGSARGRLFDSVRLSPHFAQDDNSWLFGMITKILHQIREG